MHTPSCTLRAARIVAVLMLGLAQAACDGPEAGDQRFAAVEAGDAARGRDLVTHFQCGSCHRIPGVPSAAGRTAPTLETFGRRSYIAGQVPNLAPALVHFIQAPQALVPGTRMPDMGVSEPDARDIAAYLLSLK